MIGVFVVGDEVVDVGECVVEGKIVELVGEGVVGGKVECGVWEVGDWVVDFFGEIGGGGVDGLCDCGVVGECLDFGDNGFEVDGVFGEMFFVGGDELGLGLVGVGDGVVVEWVLVGDVLVVVLEKECGGVEVFVEEKVFDVGFVVEGCFVVLDVVGVGIDLGVGFEGGVGVGEE